MGTRISRTRISGTKPALSNAELYQRVALEKERSFAILANIHEHGFGVLRQALAGLLEGKLFNFRARLGDDFQKAL